MLFVLIIIELICWAPWQIYILIQFILRQLTDVSENGGILPSPDVSFFYYEFIIKIVLIIRIFQWWKNYLQPALYEVQYWFIFFNSAINPFIYGYNNQTMQKAFRITFTCIFKDKVDNILLIFGRITLSKFATFFQPKYVLRKGEGHSTFQFTKIVEKMQKESKIATTLKTFGDDMMTPVTAHLIKKGKHRKVSRVGEMARRVARKASHLSNSIKNTHLNSVSNFSNSKQNFFQVCSYSK
jgi:hypothetical protein